MPNTAAPSGGQGKKMPPKMLFNNLEQSLYQIVLNMGIPYAFFAQFEAGLGMQYQLDGAIPALHLGVEADAATYHSNPEQVARDRKRDMELASQGWTILRFTEDEIKDHPEEVTSVIHQAIQRLANPGGGGEMRL